jgi:hypothetical protein
MFLDSGQCHLRYLALAGDFECGRNVWIGGCEFQWDVILPDYVGKDGWHRQTGIAPWVPA